MPAAAPTIPTQSGAAPSVCGSANEAAVPTPAMTAIPAAPSTNRRAASRPSTAPRSPEKTRTFAIRKGLSDVPRFAITARSTQPGVWSIT